MKTKQPKALDCRQCGDEFPFEMRCPPKDEQGLYYCPKCKADSGSYKKKPRRDDT